MIQYKYKIINAGRDLGVVNTLIGEYQKLWSQGVYFEDLNERETAGYWLSEASHNPLGEFDRMLNNNGVDLNNCEFYKNVRNLIIEALNG